MSDRRPNRKWTWYLIAPRGARPLWFTIAFTGFFLLILGAGFLVALQFMKPPSSTASAGVYFSLALASLGAILIAVGVHLSRTNPLLGIVGRRDEALMSRQGRLR